MRRRALIATLGATWAATGWPVAACAQAVAKVFRIGILESVPAERNAANLDALRRGLRDLGYVEGVNLVIDYRSADGRGEQFAELASEMLRHGVDVILARGTP